MTKNIKFDDLYIKYKQPFTRLAQSYVDDTSLAEDITTDAFVAYWENKEKLTEDANVLAYIATCIKNRCLTHLTHLRKQEEVIDDLRSQYVWELDYQITSLKAFDPEEIFSKELQNLLNKTLNTLPQKSKEIFILSRYKNLTNKEIAEALNLSIKTVEFHITKTLKVLRVGLKDYLSIFLIFL